MARRVKKLSQITEIGLDSKNIYIARIFALDFINLFSRKFRELHRMVLQGNFIGRKLLVKNVVSKSVSQRVRGVSLSEITLRYNQACCAPTLRAISRECKKKWNG